jgi:hypothetical protein
MAPQPNAVWWVAAADGKFVNSTQSAFDRAIESGDTAVASAAEYNQLHIVVAEANEERADAALQALRIVGDDYSIAWLEGIERRKGLSHRKEKFVATRLSIQRRLESHSIPPAKQIEGRFLRAGVARMCNPLEMTLPAFTVRWTQDHLNTSGVRAELTRFSEANRVQDQARQSWDRVVRDLAANLAVGLPKWEPSFK